jgi:hypothetical protein
MPAPNGFDKAIVNAAMPLMFAVSFFAGAGLEGFFLASAVASTTLDAQIAWRRVMTAIALSPSTKVHRFRVARNVRSNSLDKKIVLRALGAMQ